MDRDHLSKTGAEPLRRAPRQRRSREIVESILEATRQLLEESDPETLTTNQIADRAGISIGSLYRYFQDKEAVVASLVQNETSGEASLLAEQTWAIDDADSLEDVVIRIIDYQLDRHRRFIELGGDLYRSRNDASSLSQSMGSQVVEERIGKVLEKHCGAEPVSDLDQVAYLLVFGISAIVRLTMEERPEKLSQPGFRRALIAMALRSVSSREAAGA